MSLIRIVVAIMVVSLISAIIGVNLSCWWIVAPRMIRMLETPAHEFSHLLALLIAARVTGTPVEVRSISLFNLDFTGKEGVFRSFILMLLGRRAAGYINITEKESLKLSREARFCVGLAGGIGGTAFVIFIWWGLWQLQRRFLDISFRYLVYSIPIFHTPFAISVITSIFYAFNEAASFGFH